VVDATCGPAIGTQSLSEYVDTAIDHVASRSLKKSKEDGGKLVSPDGHADDIEDGPGVIDIVSPIRRTIPT
jgi:hypothetical protein